MWRNGHEGILNETSHLHLSGPLGLPHHPLLQTVTTKLIRLLWSRFLVGTLDIFFPFSVNKTNPIFLNNSSSPFISIAVFNGARAEAYSPDVDMLRFPGRSGMLCWHSNFWSCFFSPEQCLLRHSFPTLQRFNPACFYVGELTGAWFRLSQCSFIRICRKHCPFFSLVLNSLFSLKALKVQCKSDWNSGKLWLWAAIKIKVVPVCSPLGKESCLSLTPLPLLPAAQTPSRSVHWPRRKLMSKEKKKGEVDIFFSARSVNWTGLQGCLMNSRAGGGGWTTWPEPGTAQPGQERKKGNKEVGKYFTYSVNSTYLISSTDQNNCSCLALIISAYSLSSFSQFLLISKPFTAGVVHNLVGGL